MEFELAKGVPQVVLVPDQGVVQEFVAAGLDSALGDGVHAWYPDAGEHGLDVGVARDLVEENRGFRVPDRMRCMVLVPVSSRSMARFRVAWVMHGAVGWAVVPEIRMRRVVCSMTARMYWRLPVRVMVSMKSQARRASAWECRKSAQVVALRSGAGLMPSTLRISQTVEAATLMPSVAICRAPCGSPTRGSPGPGAGSACGSGERWVGGLASSAGRCGGGAA